MKQGTGLTRAMKKLIRRNWLLRLGRNFARFGDSLLKGSYQYEVKSRDRVHLYIHDPKTSEWVLFDRFISKGATKRGFKYKMNHYRRNHVRH